MEKAKAGAKLVTRDGRDARIVCFDRVGGPFTDAAKSIFPILGLVKEENGNEISYSYTVAGTVLISSQSANDLFILEEVEVPNFEPFQKVLVRVNDRCLWTATFFSHFSNNSINPYIVCNGEVFSQCIPFEGNEHLVGTNDDPE